ncbi:hypothetical protein C8Q79DRAFT_978406 [Trametes meyenii]|nr:hypothetical protein C8Q79DRAFT_978406 [Trametes meyenii]
MDIMFGSMLFGLTIHQTYRSFRLYYASDKGYLRTLVTVIFALEALHTLLWFLVGYLYLNYLLSDAVKEPGLLLGHW